MKNSFAVMAKLLNDRYRFVHHTLFIGLVFFFWFLFRLGRIHEQGELLKLSLYSSTYVIIAYVNIYYLFSRVLLRGKMALYVLLSLLTFVASYFAQSFIYFENWDAWKRDFTFGIPLVADMLINVITYYMFIGIGLSVKLIKKWMKSELRISTLEQENLRANLNNLKSQVSPHFLFNTFNNLYVLTKTDPKIAGEMLLGFADLMRYQLNESQNDKVRIEEEIGYIENFLNLEKLRKNHLDLRITYDKKTVSGILIAPLLFVSLVENAVKHGSQQMENPFIHVNLERMNGSFIFEVSNSKPVVSTLGKEKSLGKGIDNLSKRLNLTYPLKHQLELLEKKDSYTAKLRIELS